MSDRFPPVQGGGSLILAWQVKGKLVLVVGGGEVSSSRAKDIYYGKAIVLIFL